MSEYNQNYVFVKNFYLIGVKLFLENANGEILLLKRSDKISRGGGWDLPGGAVDKSESPTDAIRRELFEETGISIDTPVMFGSYLNTTHEDDAIILGFHATTEQTDVTISWEHDSYEWMSPDKIAHVTLPGIYAAMVHEYLSKIKITPTKR